MSDSNKNRKNYFDTDVALDVGIMSAILYANISYWCEHNEENNLNFYDGYYWTYNSIKAYKKQFPYMSEKQIRTSLKKLEDSGYIKTGCYNDDACDKTKWYADLHLKTVETPSLSICPTGQMDVTHRANGCDPQGKAIPNNNTNNNKNNNISKETKAKKSMVETVVDEFPIFVNNPDLRKEYLDFAEMRKAKGKKYEMKVESTVRTNIKNLLKLGGEDVELLKAIIERSIERCWDGFFPLPDNTEKPYYGSKPKNNGTKDWDDMRDMLCDSRLSSQNSLSNIGNVTALPSEASSTYMDSESIDILNLFK